MGSSRICSRSGLAGEPVDLRAQWLRALPPERNRSGEHGGTRGQLSAEGRPPSAVPPEAMQERLDTLAPEVTTQRP